MHELKRIRFLQDWRSMKAGDVVLMSPEVAFELVQTRVAEDASSGGVPERAVSCRSVDRGEGSCAIGR